ncbi:unnamed protein product, partial [Pylaiella littoralis]
MARWMGTISKSPRISHCQVEGAHETAHLPHNPTELPAARAISPVPALNSATEFYTGASLGSCELWSRLGSAGARWGLDRNLQGRGRNSLIISALTAVVVAAVAVASGVAYIA